MITKHKPGPLTAADREAITALQVASGLQIDGKIGRQTWRYARELIVDLRNVAAARDARNAAHLKRIRQLERENAELLAGCHDPASSDVGGFLPGLAAGIAVGVIAAALFLGAF